MESENYLTIVTFSSGYKLLSKALLRLNVLMLSISEIGSSANMAFDGAKFLGFLPIWLTFLLSAGYYSSY